jgi:hypothetical protein
MCPQRDDPGSHNRAGVVMSLSADCVVGPPTCAELCVRCAVVSPVGSMWAKSPVSASGLKGGDPKAGKVPGRRPSPTIAP